MLLQNLELVCAESLIIDNVKIIRANDGELWRSVGDLSPNTTSANGIALTIP
jgi:hypothetical protein